MNGKPEKAVHIVDKEKAKAVNKMVNRKFRRREWSWSGPYEEAGKILTAILFIIISPVAGAFRGIRDGFVSGLEKALALYRT